MKECSDGNSVLDTCGKQKTELCENCGQGGKKLLKNDSDDGECNAHELIDFLGRVMVLGVMILGGW